MESNEEFSNPEIVTIAVYNLGGVVNPIELEDVAIEAFDLAPRRFSWKKYHDRIDLRIVLYSVNDAIKPDVGYLKGNSKYGYMLTEAGSQWVTKLQNQEIIAKSSRRLSTSDLADKEKTRLQRTQAFEKFINGKEDQINRIDYREFTRISDNFPKHLQEQRLAKIQNTVDQDETLHKVWDYLKDKFLVE